MIKDQMTPDDPSVRLSAGKHLFASASSGMYPFCCCLSQEGTLNATRRHYCLFDESALGCQDKNVHVDEIDEWIIQECVWFDFSKVYNAPKSNAVSTDGLYQIGKYEGLPGLYKGTILALIGVSNGAIQFMTYEELKRWGKDRKRRKRGQALVGERDTTDLVPLTTKRFSFLH